MKGSWNISLLLVFLILAVSILRTEPASKVNTRQETKWLDVDPLNDPENDLFYEEDEIIRVKPNPLEKTVNTNKNPTLNIRVSLEKKPQVKKTVAVVSSGPQQIMCDEQFLKSVADQIADAILAQADQLYYAMNPAEAQSQGLVWSGGGEPLALGQYQHQPMEIKVEAQTKSGVVGMKMDKLVFMSACVVLAIFNWF